MLGPYNTILGNRYSGYYAQRVSYRTPYGERRTPLPYSFREVTLGAAGIPWDPNPDLPNLPGIWAIDTSWCRGDGDSIKAVQNKARDRFMSKVHGDVQGLVNLAEYRQTWGTLLSLLSAVRKPTQALNEALTKYGKKVGKGGNALLNTVAKDAADAWLAFHFGIEPLMKDLYTTAGILMQGPQAAHKAVGTAKGSSKYVYKGTGYDDWSYDESYRLRCKVGGSVIITDPNLFLQNSLGFTNPAAVVWELVPWSFVFDWFFSFGEWVNSLTDEFGIEITDVYQTTSSHVEGLLTYTTNQNYPPVGPIYTTTYRGFRISRTIGLPSVNVMAFKTAPWSLTRIFTAAALLVQQLPRSR